MELRQIFYIHSNITYLAALSAIQESNIQNPILLFGRNYSNDLIENDFHKIYLDQSIDAMNEIPSYGCPFLIFRYARSLRHLRLLIKEYGGKGYACYLPHVKNFLMQYFVMNKSCRQFSILEEGLLSYTDYKSFIKQTDRRFTDSLSGMAIRFLKYINHANCSSVYFPIRAQLKGLYFFYDSNQEDWAADNHINIRLLKWPELKIELPDYSNKSIFIFDNLNSNNFVDVENYLPIYRSIFSRFFLKDLCIKFHPANNRSSAVIDILDSMGVNYNVIEPNTPLEIVYLKSKGLKVYGLFSSLLFYAAISGHQSFSFSKTAAEIDRRVEPMMQKLMPQIFFDKVKIL